MTCPDHGAELVRWHGDPDWFGVWCIQSASFACGCRRVVMYEQTRNPTSG